MEAYMPAVQVLAIGVCISIGLYLLTEWFFHITGIEKILLKFFGQKARIGKDALPKAIGKYIAIFVFLLFLRNAVDRAGYHELEQFLSRVVEYLPHLLLALLITFFGIQSSETAHNIIYNAVRFESKKTAALLANI
jgi:amino acid permease